MGVFLCLSCISVGWYSKKNVKSGVKEVLKGGSEKNVESVGHIGW